MDCDSVVVLDITVDHMDLKVIIAFEVSCGDSSSIRNCQVVAAVDWLYLGIIAEVRESVGSVVIGPADSRDYCSCCNLLAFADTFHEVDYRYCVIWEIVAVDVNEESCYLSVKY